MLRRLLGGLAGTQPLRVTLVSFDEPHVPCARIRLADPLAQCGGKVEVRRALAHTEAGWTFDETSLDWAQVIVVQRGVPRGDTAGLCERILASGRPVVYETDDCLPEIPAYHGKDHYRENGRFVLEFATHAALVTVSSEPLREYFLPHNGNVVVLPNYLNEDLWHDALRRPRTPRESVRLGYVGNRGHRGDLAMVAPVLRRLLDEFRELELVFLGCAPDGFESLERCTFVPPDFNYQTFPARLAALDFDLAIAPLLDNPFNRCVSHLKFLEYGFLGIPGVYSDAPAYRAAVDRGCGFLCGPSEAEWYEALRALVCDSAMRTAMGISAKQAVRDGWMLGLHAHRWVDAYSAAVAAESARC